MKIRNFIQYILSILTFVFGVVLVILNTPNANIDFSIYAPYFRLILSGFGWTILISILIFILSFVLGLVFFFTSRSKIAYLRYITGHVTDLMFGTPMLVWVIFSYFFIGNATGIESKLFWGITSLTIYFGPFMMKLYVSAYESLDQNQFVVCDLFGFSKLQTYRYVIFPQMIRIMLPPLSGNLATIIKSSSLLYLIGFHETYYNITTIQSKTFAFTEGYLILLIVYLVITIPLLRLTSYLEKSVKI